MIENKFETINIQELFASRNLGLYKPDDLMEELRKIAEVNKLIEWGKSIKPEVLASYYLCYATMTDLWDPNAHDSTKPFEGLDKLKLPQNLTDNPQNILRFGCASDTSHKMEKQGLLNMDIPVANHLTIDMCNIPIERCKLINNDPRFTFRQADARNLNFLKNDSIDLATTDLLFGSMPRDEESKILKEIKRVLTPDGYIMHKIITLLPSALPSWEIGLKWQGKAIKKYGEENGRDNYIGLTEEQWSEFGKLYRTFIDSTYNSDFKHPDIKSSEKLFNDAGFKITDIKKIDDESNKDSGVFAMILEKSKS